MTRPTFRLPLTLAVAAVLAACQSYPAPLAPGAAGANIAASRGAAIGPQDKRVILKGRVQWSDLRRLMATSTDVSQSATVTLLDDAGTPVVAGLADSSGDFTLYESTEPFTPVADETFTLEVTRRGATDGSETLLSLRTIMQYTGTDWTSISGTTVVVSALTTAVTQLEAANGAVGPADVIGIVSGTDVTAFGDFTVENIQGREAEIVAKLAENVDPNQIIGETIDGSVTIATAADLALLKNAKVITGNLNINYVGATTFDLPLLEEVGGAVTIQQVVEDGVGATDLAGLASLETIGLSLLVYDDSLTSLAGLEGVTALPGGLAISSAASLESLDGLDGLTSADSVTLENLPALASLSALAALAEVTNDFRLVSLESGNLTSLGALTALTAIGGELYIEDVAALTSLDAFPALTGVANLTLVSLPALTSLTGLEGVTFPQGTADIELVSLPLIADLTGLEGLSGQVHRLALDRCPGLDSLFGTGDIAHLDELYLEATGLTTFDSVPTTLTTIDEFNVSNQSETVGADLLSNLEDLEPVTISDDFKVQGQPLLTSLDGPIFAENMVSFVVDDCDALTTLGFVNTEAIKTLSYGLRIENNALLATVGLIGLNSAEPDVKTIGTGDEQLFTVRLNPAIDICEAYGLQSERFQGSNALNDFTVDEVNDCSL